MNFYPRPTEVFFRAISMRFLPVLLLALSPSLAQAELQERLTNAEIAEINQLPWMVQVKGSNPSKDAYLTQLFKGGAIQISDKWLVTVAHIVDKDSFTSCLRIRYSNTDGKKEVKVASYIIHPDYHNTLYDPDNEFVCGSLNINDIALLKLSEPSPLGVYPQLATTIYNHDQLRPGQLAFRRRNQDYYFNATLAGYGYEDNDNLYRVEGRTYAGDCISRGTTPVQLFELFYSGATNPGDSGGALFTNDSNPVLVGLINQRLDYRPWGGGFSVTCQSIAYHLDFIQHYTGINITRQEENTFLNVTAPVPVSCYTDAVYAAITVGPVLIIGTFIATILLCMKCKKSALPESGYTETYRF